MAAKAGQLSSVQPAPVKRTRSTAEVVEHISLGKEVAKKPEKL